MHLNIAIACIEQKQPISPEVNKGEYRYLLWNPKQKPPHFVHKTKSKARREAMRIKKLDPTAKLLLLVIKEVL